MSFMMEKPPETTGNVKEDIEQMRDYLLKLSKDINYCINHLDTGNFTSEFTDKINKLLKGE